MVSPYQQGDLDRLCGLYAVINSIRFSLKQCRPLRKQDCRALYVKLTGQLEEEGSLADALAVGLATPEISCLLKVAEQWVFETKGISVRHKKPFHKHPRITFPKMLHKLSSHLETPDTSILALAQGRVDHWTVIHTVDAKNLRLFDSHAMHRFGLHNAHSDPPKTSGKTLHIVPTGIFLIKAISS